MMSVLNFAVVILITMIGIQGHTFQGFISWPKKPCCARDISARNGEIMSQAGGTDNTVYWFNGNSYQSTNIAGLSVAASPDGWHWLVTATNQLSRWNSTAKIWEPQSFATGVAQVSAMSKTRILIRKTDNSIALCENGLCSPMKGFALWVGIGQNDERWMVSQADKRVWRFNVASGMWDLMPGENAKRIDVLGSEAVAMVAQNNTVYLWENKSWSPIEGSSCEWVTLDFGRMWCTMPDAKIFYGDIMGPYPAPLPPTQAPYQPSPDVSGAMASGQCKVTIHCPYMPAPAPAVTSCSLS